MQFNLPENDLQRLLRQTGEFFDHRGKNGDPILSVLVFILLCLFIVMLFR